MPGGNHIPRLTLHLHLILTLYPHPYLHPNPAPTPHSQVVHYTPGQEYRDHVDYFSSADERVVERMGAALCRNQGPPTSGLNSIAQASAATEEARGGTWVRTASANQPLGPHWSVMSDFFNIGAAGNRLVSVLVYLSCAAEGGETQFTSLGLNVTPTPGTALLWHNFDRKGVLDRRTLHCGHPVLAGEKWGMNIWFRQRPLTSLQAGAERPPWPVQPPTQTMPSRAAIESASLRERFG